MRDRVVLGRGADGLPVSTRIAPSSVPGYWLPQGESQVGVCGVRVLRVEADGLSVPPPIAPLNSRRSRSGVAEAMVRKGVVRFEADGLLTLLAVALPRPCPRRAGAAPRL